jgi:hypothetical protein
MSNRSSGGLGGRRLAGYVAAAGLLCACGGGAAVPAAAVGKVGGELPAQARLVPQGGELCALKEAANTTSGKAVTSVSEPCKKAVNSDLVWRGSLGVLGAYGRHLSALAAGDPPEISGPLHAALTGVRGPNWVSAEGGAETEARTAAAELVDQMSKSTSDSGLEPTIKAAGPRVDKLCSGLQAFLDAQIQEVDALSKDIPTKETAPGTKRCAMLDNRPLCMADSVVDHMLYANELGRMEALGGGYHDVRNTVAAFCAGHAKLAQAAAAGNLSSKQTLTDVVDAVRKAVPEQGSAAAAGPPGKTGDKKK